MSRLTTRLQRVQAKAGAGRPRIDSLADFTFWDLTAEGKAKFGNEPVYSPRMQRVMDLLAELEREHQAREAHSEDRLHARPAR